MIRYLTSNLSITGSLGLALLCAPGALAQAQRPAPPGATTPPAAAAPAQPPRTNAQTVEDLLAQLKVADSVEKAHDLEQRIQRIWLKSGSDTVDLLMARALQGVNDKDYPLALDLLNQVTILKPDYAQGWGKRAAVYYMQDDYGRALADLRRALTLEPRDFSAMMGLGVILGEFDQKQAAITVFKKVLEIDPQLDSAKKQLDDLLKATGGRDI